MNNLIQIDCKEYMKDIPDNHFDLAIVDPPYFEGPNKGKSYYQGKNNLADCIEYEEIKTWDIPSNEYFDQLFRIAKNQIIWGVNYFNYSFPVGRTVWIKMKKEGPFSQCEIACNSMHKKSTVFEYLWNGFWQENMKNREIRIHPSQKPVALYKWLLKNYAKPGDKLLDTHSGSGSFRIAAHDLGFDLVSCELDPDYCRDNEARYQKHIQQIDLFKPEEIQENVYKNKELFDG